jgi:hypothetical protein
VEVEQELKMLVAEELVVLELHFQGEQKLH